MFELSTGKDFLHYPITVVKNVEQRFREDFKWAEVKTACQQLEERQEYFQNPAIDSRNLNIEIPMVDPLFFFGYNGFVLENVREN